MTLIYWFGIENEESDLYGEEVFIEVDTTPDLGKIEAMKVAKEIFPNEVPKCYGRVSLAEAEMMGLDTY